MVILLLLLCCVACGQSDAARAQRYLAETDRSLQEICELGKEFEVLGGELQTQVRGNYTKAHLTRVALTLEPRVKALATRLAVSVAHLKELEAPPSCKAYHDTLMEMLEPFEKGVAAYTELTGGMQSGLSVTTFAGQAGEILRSIETAQAAARKAQEERQKLLDEYQIKVGPDGLVPRVP